MNPHHCHVPKTSLSWSIVKGAGISISVSCQGRKLLVPWVGPDSVCPSTVLWSPVKAGRKPQKGQRSLLKTYTVFGNGLGLYRRPIRALTFYIIVIHFVFVFVFFFKTERLSLEFLLFPPLNSRP